MSILSLFGCGPSKAPSIRPTSSRHATAPGSRSPFSNTPRCRSPRAANTSVDLRRRQRRLRRAAEGRHRAHHHRTTTTSTWRRSRNCSRPTRRSLRPHVGRGFRMNCYTMRPGSVATPRDWVKVEAVAAYNTTPGHLQFHPKRAQRGRGTSSSAARASTSRATRADAEMRALRDIDIAFLPVNQPYTMTVEQAAEAVKAPAGDLLPLPLRRGGGKRPTSTGWCARPRTDRNPGPPDGIAA